MLAGRPPAELTIAQRPAQRRHSKASSQRFPQHWLERAARQSPPRNEPMQEQKTLSHRRPDGCIFSPTISLSAALCSGSGSRPPFFPSMLANEIWSLGGRGHGRSCLTADLRGAQIDEPRVRFIWQSVATYRQNRAFFRLSRESRDELAAISHPAQQHGPCNGRLSALSGRPCRIYLESNFQGGTAPFTNRGSPAQIQLLSYEEKRTDHSPEFVFWRASLLDPGSLGWRLGTSICCRPRENSKSDFSLFANKLPAKPGRAFGSESPEASCKPA